MKSLQLLIAFFLLLILTSSSKIHEYYVSITKMEYVKEQKSLQIISQIFIDDFEKLLRQRYDEKITLDAKNELKQVETYMQRYLEDKLKISINRNEVNFKFIGKEYEDDIVYCYLEVENVSDLKSVTVVNRILFDLYPEQQNIVRLKLNSKIKSFLLIKEDDTCVLNLD